MKRNKFIGYTMMAAAMLAAASCSDFDDYNSEPSSGTEGQSGKMLWENISQNEQLTDFAKLVQRTGFDSYLSQSRAYTVWAPVNGKFDVAAYEALNDSTLLAQFVKNHVAEFNHVASGDMGENNSAAVIRMLNGKSYRFAGSGSYTFDDIKVNTPNVPNSNGILHLLDDAVRFYPNVYEYLMQSLDKEVEENVKIDSIAAYYKKYERTRLDKEASEKGPMVNGMQTYIDSVMITTNSLTSDLKALIQNEDSTYTILLPNNKAYLDMYDKVKNYYKFTTNLVMQDVANLEKASATSTTGDKERNAVTKTAPTINKRDWQDSLTRRAIARYLVFSNNDGYNQFITERTPTEGDSLRTTTGTLLSNPQELLYDHLVGEPIKMSNGIGRIVDSIAVRPWETYSGEIIAYPRIDVIKTFTANETNILSHRPDLAEQLIGPGAKEFRWKLIENSTDRTTPDVFLRLPGVRAVEYDFYCVVLPYYCGKDSNRVSPMNFDLSYCRENASGDGVLDNYHFSAKYISSGKKADEDPATLNKTTAFENDPTKLDTLYLGRFTFPLNYSGLRDDDGNVNAYYPSLHISSPVSSSSDRKKFSREFRIYAIILRPVEMEDFEANNK